MEYKEIVTEQEISIYAVSGNECMGSATCSHCFGKEHTWYFNRLFVQPGCRGNGVGSELLAHLLKQIHKKGDTLLLEISPYGELDDKELQMFYERHGFRKRSENVWEWKVA